MLLKKQISEIFIAARDLLQDQQRVRYPDQELFRYLDQGVRDIALNTKHNRITTEIYVNDPNIIHLSDEYTLPFEAIEFESITNADSNLAIIQPYDIIDAYTIKFPEKKEQKVKVIYYAFPPRILYGAVTEIELDEDLYDALNFYIAHKAYQKEASTENLSKSQYFRQEYISALSRNTIRWHGTFEVETSKQDFYL